jgi:hypothetical protein
MRKFPLLLLLLFAGLCGHLRAQAPADSDAIRLIDRPHAQDWSSDIVNGWRTQTGDDPSWASPGFDDSAWKTVELDDLGPAQQGWRWFRLHVKLHENHPDLALLIQGGDGTYVLYINGRAAIGPVLRSSFRVKRPTERVVPIDEPGTDLVIALRTFTPPGYTAWHLPLFMTAAIGTPPAIENERQAIESGRLYGAIPSIAINLLLILAGLAVFALHRSQPSHSEYQWLGAYLFLLGLGDLLWISQIYGLFALSLNFLVADALSYAVTIAQIEFTFSFGGRRVSLPWRVYEVLLVCALPLAWLTWVGLIPGATYLLIEAVIILPVLLLPVLLFIWYRRGNREAGWLILPSLLQPAYTSLGNLGSVSIFFGWRSLDFLDNTVDIGAASLHPGDICAFLFLMAIAVVMFFRFTRVSRDQARAAAELAAAREIQQHLVPASLPSLPGYRIETAYLPAQEVGGDFYQVLEQPDRSTLIVVGDVSGKGLKAAMTGALAIGALRTLAAESLSPATMLARLNRQIVKGQDGGFITCLCARFALDGSVRLANAGHLSPYRSGKEIEVNSGLPLGLVAEVEYSETGLQLAAGETITLLSDGVVEARNADGQLYGFERTRAISSQSAENIAAAAQAFGQEDDITVLTVARVASAVA